MEPRIKELIDGLTQNGKPRRISCSEGHEVSDAVYDMDLKIKKAIELLNGRIRNCGCISMWNGQVNYCKHCTRDKQFLNDMGENA